MKKIAILHGPNLDRLGRRQPAIYGTATLKDLEKMIRAEAKKIGFTVTFFQSAHEGALVDKIHALTDRGTLIDTTPEMFAASGLPAVEVHISDIKKREKFRHHTMTAGACIGMISGQGFPGYLAALRLLAKL